MSAANRPTSTAFPRAAISAARETRTASPFAADRMPRNMDTVPVNIADRRREMRSLPLFKPTTHAFDVSALAIPAKSFTGDFYYVERCEEGLWFALGDVAGK